MRADAVIVLLPGGPGTHVEMGIAIGCELPLCVVGHMPRKDPRWPRCPFYLLGIRVETADEAIGWLSAVSSERERRGGGNCILPSPKGDGFLVNRERHDAEQVGSQFDGCCVLRACPPHVFRILPVQPAACPAAKRFSAAFSSRSW